MSDNKKKRVAVYCRVSTENQETSFLNQKQYYETYVKNNPEWELVKIYADEGISGTLLNKNRKEFYQMMNDCGIDIIQTKNKFSVEIIENKPTRIDMIIVKDEKRFSRNISIMEIIEKLRVKKVGIYFETLGINTLTSDDATLNLLFSMSDSFSKSLSRNLKLSYERKHKVKPMVLGHYPPFGYKFGLDENNERTLIPISDEHVKVVNDIFDLYIQGQGYRLIAKYVNEQGFTTINNKPFDKYSIERILKNEKYFGVIQVITHTPESLTLFGHTNRKYMDYVLIKSEKIIPMIDEEKFYKAKKLLKAKIDKKKKRGIKTSKSKYANKLICANCKNSYLKTVDSKGADVYVCSSKREKLGDANKCKSPYISEKFVDDYIDELFSNMNFIKNEQENIQRIIDNLIFYKYCLISVFLRDRDEELINTLKEKIKELDEKQSKIFDMFNGKISVDTLAKKINEIDEEKSVLKKQLDKQDFSFENFKQDLDNIDNGIRRLENFKIENIKTKEELLDLIVIFVKPKSPNSTIRQKRNDCELFFRSEYADLYQEIEYEVYNNFILNVDDEIRERVNNQDFFTEEMKKELDLKLIDLL